MKLIHLAQVHKNPYNEAKIDSGEFNECVSSQLKIANYLIRYPLCHVIAEGVIDTSLVGLNAKASAAKVYLNKIFPTGFPEAPEELTDMQKKLLYSFGASFIMFGLGKIKLHRSTSPQFEKLYIESSTHWSPLDHIHLFEEREKEAMTCIQEIIFDEEPNEMILIYGGAHDFSSYCDKLGYQYERIETAEGVYQEMQRCNQLKLLWEFDPQVIDYRENEQKTAQNNIKVIGRIKQLIDIYDPLLKQLKLQITHLRDRAILLRQSNQPVDETESAIHVATNLYDDLLRYRDAYASDETISCEEFIVNSREAINMNDVRHVLGTHRIKWMV